MQAPVADANPRVSRAPSAARLPMRKCGGTHKHFQDATKKRLQGGTDKRRACQWNRSQCLKLAPLTNPFVSATQSMVAIAALALLALLSGCASTNWVSLREAPKTPLVERLNLMARGGPKPTERTMQFLRRYDLVQSLEDEPRELLGKIQYAIEQDPSPDGCHAFAELAYISGVKRQSDRNPRLALDLFGASVAHSYLYLFDPRFAQYRNPYDPQFREACDLYNGALEGALRIVQSQGTLRPGSTHSIELAGQKWDVAVAVRSGPWSEDEFDRFEFVSDYEVKGLQNRYHIFGLGVPLIAVRKAGQHSQPAEEYFPPVVSFPMTAFLRLLPDEPQADGGSEVRHRAVLELYDPLTSHDIVVSDRRIPLESDLSTPLAFMLGDPALAKLDSSTSGLLRPEETRELTGLYMLEPYHPRKIPVVFVHGLWSSPITWMEMFNDLQATPELRDNYQFWFYLYPTGQPFWMSATRLRDDLAEMRARLDPGRQHAAVDQMVLVGHSMGGLVSRMQTIASGNDFWNIVSDKPFHLVRAEPPVRAELEKMFFFGPNPSIRRVITIGTPHRGSSFATETARWLGNKLISLPSMLVERRQQFREENADLFRPDTKLFEVSTSIDSLAPDSPILPALFHAQPAPWTQYHNIVGRLPDEGFLNRFSGDGDGVVEYESAHLDNVASEITVPADHVNVHRHPLAVLEVRRILLAQLEDLRRQPSYDGSPRTAILPPQPAAIPPPFAGPSP
jgi:pimeloyl-ACP methyl ester carboxylesterase